MKARRGFTLIELMIAIVVIGVLLALAAPSFYDFILVQRLKSINAQLVTDMQFARSEAASRGVDVQVIFKPAGEVLSCYTLYTDPAVSPWAKCDCTQPVATRCPNANTREVRTVQLPTSQGVRLSVPDGQARELAFQAISGGVRVKPSDFGPAPMNFVVEASIDAQRRLHTRIGQAGRTMVCSPEQGVQGYAAC